uniref:Uncharacterized protein n=1 Tax=Triticum urartu TaxID=4572 RepID=A0A8R7QVH7_TRIUA
SYYSSCKSVCSVLLKCLTSKIQVQNLKLAILLVTIHSFFFSFHFLYINRSVLLKWLQIGMAVTESSFSSVFSLAPSIFSVCRLLVIL